VRQMRVNKLKAKIKRGDPVLGTFLFFPSPHTVELLGYAGFDFVIVDTEHGPTGPLDTVLLENLIRASEVADITPLVRIPERSRVVTQKILDAGALGVVVPFIHSGEETREAVLDTKYPPQGHRGACYLTRPTAYTTKWSEEYWSDANRETMVVPMIEDQAAVEKIDEILDVPGVDFVFFGGRDHSMTCGYPTPSNPATQAARKRLSEACARRGIPLAHFLYPPFEKSVQEGLRSGAKILVAGGDNALLLQILQSTVKAFHSG